MKSRRAFLLAVIAGSACLSPAVGRAEAPILQSTAILDGAVTVPAAGHVSYPINVDLASMTSPTIKGYVQASGGSGNDIVVLILRDTDYVNWKNGHAVTPLFSSEQVTASEVFAQPATSGTYYLVLSNTFSAFTPKSVAGKVQLMWVPTALVEANQRTTEALNIAQVILGVLLVASLAWLVWALMAARKRKGAAGAERKVA